MEKFRRGTPRLDSSSGPKMRNEKVQKALERLEKGIEELLISGKWLEYLKFQARFRKYSFANTMLIFTQKPDATWVSGYKEWQKMGRYVKKGERGIQILAPVIVKKKKQENQAINLIDQKDVDDPEALIEEEEEKILVGFKTVYVFDVSQTDGKPLPSVVEILDGTVGWYERLKTVCPYPVHEKDDCNGANGYFSLTNKEIAILASLPEKQKTKTLLHEWAHGLLHLNSVEHDLDREIKELEAEATAYIVGQCLNLEFNDYTFGYIAHWTKGEETVQKIKRSGERIIRAVNQIMDCVENTRIEERAS